MDRNLKIHEVCQQVARAYARRCWWADTQELIQEGWLAALEQDLSHIPDEYLGGYVNRVVSSRLYRFLWSQSSPVTGARGGRHLRGLQRAELPPDLGVGRSPELELLRAVEAQRAPIVKQELRSRFRHYYSHETKRLVRYYGETRQDLPLLATSFVLLEGGSPAGAVERWPLVESDVYAEVYFVKRKVKSDPVVRRLAGEILDRRSYEAQAY